MSDSKTSNLDGIGYHNNVDSITINVPKKVFLQWRALGDNDKGIEFDLESFIKNGGDAGLAFWKGVHRMLGDNLGTKGETVAKKREKNVRKAVSFNAGVLVMRSQVAPELKALRDVVAKLAKDLKVPQGFTPHTASTETLQQVCGAAWPQVQKHAEALFRTRDAERKLTESIKIEV
jgi:hypothetical protein